MPGRKLSLAWKSVVVICLFIAAFLVADRVGSFMIRKIVLRSKVKFSLLYRGGLKKDIVLIGNSRGESSLYAPDIQKATGGTTLQLSFKGMSTELSEILLRDYYEHNAPPKLLIIEITNLLSQDDLIYDLKAYSFWSPRMLEEFRRADPKGYAFATISNLHFFNGEMFIRALFSLHRSDQSDIRRGRMTRDMLTAIRPEERRLRTENLEALRRIVELANEKGTEVRLLIAPIYPDLCRAISNKAEWAPEIRKWIGPDVKIWDYSGAIPDPGAFSDPYHLNVTGSRELLKLLERDGFFGTGKAGGFSAASSDASRVSMSGAGHERIAGRRTSDISIAGLREEKGIC